MNYRKYLIFSLALSLVFISGCGRKEEPAPSQVEPTSVKGRSVAASLTLRQDLTYPGTVAAESEARISAKAAASLTGVKFKVGDAVDIGDEIARIDDLSAISDNTSFSNNQIKQARLLVEQAQAGYDLAKQNYNNILISSVKDLRSAEIARDQAGKGQSNLEITTGESLKSAELAYETSKIATEQARLNLDNKEKLTAQSTADTKENAEVAASSAAGTAAAVITGINNLTGFDDNNSVSVPYTSSLGALDYNSYGAADYAYAQAKAEYSAYSKASFDSIEARLAAVKKLAEKTKTLAEATKYLFEKSIPSSALPQTSAAGVSLNGLQQSAISFQSQINGALTQVNSASQALNNLALNNSSLLDSLRQAYELAKRQEDIAAQSLTNLKAGNASQKDQAGFAYNLAQNQYDNLKVKIESQVTAAKTQMETAELQYNNAILSLQGLYDAHSVISPIKGKITRLFIGAGEAVAIGQPVATVSQTDNIKINFFIEPENLLNIKSGWPVTVKDQSGQEYQGVISSVSLQADPATRRFPAEVRLDNAPGLLLGTIVDVKLSLIKSGGLPGLIFLPLSAVNIGQSGNSIFIFDNGLAKSMPVEIVEVIGETAKIKSDPPLSAVIITEGNKLLSDGQAIKLIE